MARVLIFHPALPPYRLDTFNSIGEFCDAKLVLLQRNLISQSFDQHKLTSQLSLPFSYLDKGFRVFNKNFRTGILSEVRKFNPDIIIAPEYSPTTLIILLSRILGNECKVVVWTDDNPESVKSESIFRRIVRRFVEKSIDGLILASEPALDIYKGIRTQKCVAPILQNERVFRGRLHKCLTAANSLAADQNLFGKKILLYVGRLSKEKRVDKLLECFSEILKVQPMCHLVLIGDGPLRLELKNIADRLNIANHVHFGGRCEGNKLLAWYAIGQVFFLMSEYEQFGAVVNEALISGLPVICSQAAGAKTLIRDGFNGYVVDASNIQTTTQAALKIIDKIQPLTIDSSTQIKPNLMTTSFEDATNGLRRLIENLTSISTN